MSVYVISSDVDIASISKHAPTKKIAAKYFSTLLAIYIPILLKKPLRELNYLKLKRKLIGLFWDCRKSLIDINKV